MTTTIKTPHRLHITVYYMSRFPTSSERTANFDKFTVDPSDSEAMEMRGEWYAIKTIKGEYVEIPAVNIRKVETTIEYKVTHEGDSQA